MREVAKALVALHQAAQHTLTERVQAPGTLQQYECFTRGKLLRCPLQRKQVPLLTLRPLRL